MAEKTIKELAEEFHVSKTTIRKKLTAHFRANYVQTVTRNGVQTLVISETGYILLKQEFLGGNPTANQVQTVSGNTANQVSGSELLVLLEKQLTQKDIQLQEKDTQLKQMQRLLDQQQQLTLQANKQIETLQEQLQLTSEEAAEQIHTEQALSAEKKWWQFWKEK